VLTAAALQLVPSRARDRIGLDDAPGLPRWQRELVRATGRVADGLVLQSHPAVQACRRLGLPNDFLYVRR